MNFSFSTIFTAILTSSLLLILLTLLLQSSRIMIAAGHKIFIFVILLVSLRMLIPFEFPFTKNIYLPKLLSKIVANIRYHRFYAYGNSLSLWNIFVIIWIIGIVVRILYCIHDYHQAQKNIIKFGTDVTTQKEYIILLNNICHTYHVNNIFKVYKLPYLSIPMIFGIRSPYILIPETLKLTSKELFYVLSHEIVHYYYHDLIKKLLIQILCIIYWWNPICILLKKQANLFLEMRVDEHITFFGTTFREEYLACILHIRKNYVYAKDYPFTISLCSENKTFLIQRFRMMTNTKPVKHKHLLNRGIFLSTIVIFFLSYLFILEANYTLPEIAETTCELSPENTYLIQSESGFYDVYFNQIYIETVGSLEMYQDNYPIYQSIMEVYEK